MGMVTYGGIKKDFDLPFAGQQPPTTSGQFDRAAAGGPAANSLNPVALFGFYAKWSLFRF